VPLFQQITLNPALQLAAGGQLPNSQAPTLTQAELQPIVTAAIARWAAAGLDAADVAKLSHVQFVITSLPAGELGLTQSGQIFLDNTAAGYGWFINGSSASDAEFAASAVSAGIRAVDPQALDRIDLLTVVEHELGHIVGLGDLTSGQPDLMDETLGVGVRRDPSAADVDAALASR
jgi:predicted Zn-dependent protease